MGKYNSFKVVFIWGYGFKVNKEETDKSKNRECVVIVWDGWLEKLII